MSRDSPGTWDIGTFNSGRDTCPDGTRDIQNLPGQMSRGTRDMSRFAGHLRNFLPSSRSWNCSHTFLLAKSTIKFEEFETISWGALFFKNQPSLEPIVEQGDARQGFGFHVPAPSSNEKSAERKKTLCSRAGSFVGSTPSPSPKTAEKRKFPLICAPKADRIVLPNL